MKTTEILKAIMTAKDVGVTKLASRLGKKTNVISERVRQTNISIDKLNEMLRVLDYKVVIVPIDGKLPKDSFEVE